MVGSQINKGQKKNMNGWFTDKTNYGSEAVHGEFNPYRYMSMIDKNSKPYEAIICCNDQNISM